MNRSYCTIAARARMYRLMLVFGIAAMPLSAGAAPPTDTGDRSVHDESAELPIEDIDLLELDIPVVVTGLRLAQPVKSLPYAVSIITAEDIRQSGARTVPDALRLAAGVDVADLGYAAAAVSPRGLHGFHSRPTLVLVDGRQVFDALYGGTIWGTWPFQMEDIERIEAIRGPSGVSWGANAANGLINIITKDPRDQQGFTLKTAGASRGTNLEHFGYGLRDGNLRLRVSGEHESSDGWRGGSLYGPALDDYRAGRFNLHAIYAPDANNTLTISGGSSVTEGGLASTPLGGFGVIRQAGSRSNFLMAKWLHRKSYDESVEVVAYVNDWAGSFGTKTTNYQYQQLALQFSHTLVPADNHTMVWGMDSRADILDASHADPQLLSRDFVGTGVVAIYVENSWRFAPKWTLDLGGRMDYEFYGGFQPSARTSLSYAIDDQAMIYAAASRAFQMAPAGLRFLDFPMLNGLAHAVGKRSLDAEGLFAYEIGYRAVWFDRMDVSLTGYWHDYDDLTTRTPQLGPPGLISARLDNRASAALYGVEFDARHRVNDRLTLVANYTYQDLVWSAEVPYQHKELIEPPANKFMVGARYRATEDLHLAAHLYYVDATRAPNVNLPFGARHIDRYFRLDLRAEYEFMDDEASFAVGVRNLLDRGHVEGGTYFLNSVESERMVYAEFRLAIPTPK